MLQGDKIARIEVYAAMYYHDINVIILKYHVAPTPDSVIIGK